MNQQPSDGVFITIEGIEGVGKSTAVQFIEQYLKEQQHAFIVTREPGGTLIAEQIRQVLLKPNADEIMQPETELLLMFAARVQHIHHVILPALRAGKWVVSDRFVDASFAYQGGGRQMDLARIQQLDEWLVNGLQPTLTILLDASPDIGMARAKHRGPHDRIEQEKITFFERVRQAYLERAANDPKRIRIIDATQPLPAVQAELKQVIDELRQ